MATMQAVKLISGVLEDVGTAGRVAALPKILDVVCRTTGMGFSVLARVTHDRWVACGVQDNIPIGISPTDELDVETTVCHRVLQQGSAVIIDDASKSDLFRDHPARRLFGFQSFISVPVIMPDGSFFGTLSALDRTPRPLGTVETVKSFELFADLVALHLDKEFQLESSQRELVLEREMSELREQFIAVLGHDLRNPLASIRTGGWVIKRQPERASEMAGLIEESVGRMSGLIDDVMDFAHGRLGTGVPVSVQADVRLAPVIAQIVAEIGNAHPDRIIDLDLTVDAPFRCDPGRIGQLLSNLLSNALAHGAPDQPVAVYGHLTDGVFELGVANRGDPIDPDTLKRLFRPFVRATDRADAAGLGLGLFIASQIAKQHGGLLEARSTPDETSFFFRMPVDGDVGAVP